MNHTYNAASTTHIISAWKRFVYHFTARIVLKSWDPKRKFHPRRILEILTHTQKKTVHNCPHLQNCILQYPLCYSELCRIPNQSSGYITTLWSREQIANSGFV